MNRILESLLPIILLVAVGTVLSRGGFLSAELRRGLDRLVYFVALPSLIVAKLSQAGAVSAEAGQLLLILVSATAVSLIVGYLTARTLRMSGRGASTLVQAAFRGNLAFVGLPVIDLATQGDEHAVALAALVLGPMVAVYNVAAVVVLLLGQHQWSWSILPRALRSLLVNPLLIACALGGLLALIELPLPSPITTTLGLLGQTAAPLALLSLGGALATYPLRTQIGPASAASLLKVGLTPAVAWGIATLSGLAQTQLLVILVFAATPTAVASYVLAGQLGGDEPLAASSIVLSTLLSAGSLAAAMIISSW